MNRKLTREEAIRLHREMWTNMQAELGDDPDVGDRIYFKKKWVREHFPDEHIRSNCFLCEYANQLAGIKGLETIFWCDYCPIKWNSAIPPTCNPGIFAFWDDNKVDYRYSPISEILALPESYDDKEVNLEEVEK